MIMKINNICSRQFEFRENMGSTDTLYEFVNDIKISVESSKKCLVIFLDSAIAYIPHVELLKVIVATECSTQNLLKN